MQIFLEKVISFNQLRCSGHFDILLVSEPTLLESIKKSWMAEYYDYENVKDIEAELPDRFKSLSESLGCKYLNAADFVVASDDDGCHMDAENQRILGRIMAEYVKNELNSLEK